MKSAIPSTGPDKSSGFGYRRVDETARRCQEARPARETREGEQELRERIEKVLAENERLRKELEEALRSLKRQTAPFSKGEPKPNPKPPGRKPGAEYGQRASRPIPARVDEQIPVPPSCGGSMSRSAGVPVVGDTYRAATRCRRPMPCVRHKCSWDPRPFRWQRISTRKWVSRTSVVRGYSNWDTVCT